MALVFYFETKTYWVNFPLQKINYCEDRHRERLPPNNLQYKLPLIFTCPHETFTAGKIGISTKTKKVF